MKINLLIMLSLTIIIGIALIPIIGSLSSDALSGITEEVPVESDLLYANVPISIKADDTLVITLPDVVNNVVYTEHFRNISTDATIWGFSQTGDSVNVHYNSTLYELIGGTWDAPVFGAEFSDAWIDWSVDGTIGTLTFLQDFPVDLIGIYISTNPGVLKTSWFNTTNISTFSILNTVEEVPVYDNADTLVNLIPFFSVLVLIGTVIVYIKFKKE